MGPCSFDNLKYVDREACQQSGLLENDRHHNEAQTEADVARSPSALCSDCSLSVYVRKLNVVIFFAIILQNTFKIS